MFCGGEIGFFVLFAVAHQNGFFNGTTGIASGGRGESALFASFIHGISTAEGRIICEDGRGLSYGSQRLWILLAITQLTFSRWRRR